MSTLDPQAADRLAKRLVANHPFPGASHAALEGLLGEGEVLHLPAGDALCKEGDAGDEMWFLLRGTIRVQRTDAGGEARDLAVIDAPALIGHMALIDRSRRSASCVAIGDVEIVKVGSVTYDRLLDEASESGAALRRLLLSSLCGQLTQANAQVRDLVEELTAKTTPEAAPEPKPEARRPSPRSQKKAGKPTSTEDRVAQLTAKLGGWDANLAELESLESEIELVFDEDQRRRRDRKKGLS